MTTTTDPPATAADSLTALWHEVRADLADLFDTIEWAEDEIKRASCRHPDQADVLHHAFPLLTPGPGMHVESVYRGHVRELLERAAAGQDTRPATAAEVCLIASQASLRVPLNGIAAGLYLRMWAQAFPNAEQPGADRLEHREALDGPQIDDLERDWRRRAAVAGRRLGKVECSGRHHGEQVVCRYADPASRRFDEA